jgi:hypothetical protein
MCEANSLPLLLGGDTNIIYHQNEKNNAHINVRCPFILSAIIEVLT